MQTSVYRNHYGIQNETAGQRKLGKTRFEQYAWSSSNATSTHLIFPHAIWSLSPPRLTFLAWGDFHASSRLARSTIPEEKWGLLVVY